MTTAPPTRYGTVAMTLHWLIAFAIVMLLAVGKVMHELPDNDPNKFFIYQMHKSFGITVLALTVVRIVWRVMHPVPAAACGDARVAAVGRALEPHWTLRADARHPA